MNTQQIELIVDLALSVNVEICFTYIPADVLSSADKLENLYYGSESYSICVFRKGVLKGYENLLESTDREKIIKCLKDLDSTNIAYELDSVIKKRGWRTEELKYFKEGSAKYRNFRDDVLALKYGTNNDTFGN